MSSRSRGAAAGAFTVESSFPNGTQLIPPPNPLTATIPVSNALPKLQYVSERLSVGIYSNSTITYTFDGFPASVVRVPSITITNTSFQDVAYLSNMVCAPQSLTIRGNRDLVSLGGINAWPAYAGPLAANATSLNRLEMAENPKLLRAGYAPLGPVLQCNATANATSPSNVTVNVSTATCGSFASATGLCSFITGNVPDCWGRQ